MTEIQDQQAKMLLRRNAHIMQRMLDLIMVKNLGRLDDHHVSHEMCHAIEVLMTVQCSTSVSIVTPHSLTTRL